MIEILETVQEAMSRAAEAAYPEECCGALLGRVDGEARRVLEIMPLRNARDTRRERRFRITPDDYRRAEQRAEERGLMLIGFYHSHPDHPARPSEYDQTHALPWHSYVIVGVERGVARAWTSWILSADRSRFERESTEPLCARGATTGTAPERSS